jgi:Glucose / Sorbosone dehydrogenase
VAKLYPKRLFIIFVVSVFFCRIGRSQNPQNDLINEWAVEPGYSLKIVANGFELPTAIAVVKNPGSNSKSPKMFVTELRGNIKTIANDGSVTDFAKVETFAPKADWPDKSGEAGMAGICINDDRGFVFTTYAYRDKLGVLRNGMSRFSVTPHTFEGKPWARHDYVDLFKTDVSSFSHQIGGCVVDGDSIYVGIGDGGEPSSSRALDKLVGKIIRLTLDGTPYSSNPFASQGGKASAVIAYGLRNPFGLAVVDNQVFAAENGVNMDRFFVVQPGWNYMWDGTDGSIATNAAVVFYPTICPVQIAFAPQDQNGLSSNQNAQFLISSSKFTRPGIVSVQYDMVKKKVVRSPKMLVRYERESPGQGVVGLGLASDAIYFCPILPVGDTGVVMELRYDPTHPHTRTIGQPAGVAQLINSLGCLKCHVLNGVGGTQGPSLDRVSLKQRVRTRVLDPSYAELIERLDKIPAKPIRTGKAARREVLSAKGDSKVELWVINRILYPRFDEPNAQMPSFNLTRAQAQTIADYLLKGKSGIGINIKDVLISRRFWSGFGLGLLIGLASMISSRLKRRSAKVPKQN